MSCTARSALCSCNHLSSVHSEERGTWQGALWTMGGPRSVQGYLGCRGTTLVNIPLISKGGLSTWTTWHKAWGHNALAISRAPVTETSIAALSGPSEMPLPRNASSLVTEWEYCFRFPSTKNPKHAASGVTAPHCQPRSPQSLETGLAVNPQKGAPALCQVLSIARALRESGGDGADKQSHRNTLRRTQRTQTSIDKVNCSGHKHRSRFLLWRILY